MKQSNIGQRLRTGHRIAGHAQEDHILDPTRLSKSCMKARSARNAAPSTTTGTGGGWRRLGALTRPSVKHDPRRRRRYRRAYRGVWTSRDISASLTCHRGSFAG